MNSRNMCEIVGGKLSDLIISAVKINWLGPQSISYVNNANTECITRWKHSAKKNMFQLFIHKEAYFDCDSSRTTKIEPLIYLC
jgi:hypothetical protein